ETMAGDVGSSGAERWGLTSISPLGFVPWWQSALHVFYDSWVHERDALMPLGAAIPVVGDEAVPVLTYSLAVPGTLITEPTDTSIAGVHLITGEGSPVARPVTTGPMVTTMWPPSSTHCPAGASSKTRWPAPIPMSSTAWVPWLAGFSRKSRPSSPSQQVEDRINDVRKEYRRELRRSRAIPLCPLAGVGSVRGGAHEVAEVSRCGRGRRPPFHRGQSDRRLCLPARRTVRTGRPCRSTRGSSVSAGPSGDCRHSCSRLWSVRLRGLER